MSAEKHKHNWHYEHTIFEGRTPIEVAVVRYCECGVKQLAFASDWQKPPKNYDLSYVGKPEEAVSG